MTTGHVLLGYLGIFVPVLITGLAAGAVFGWLARRWLCKGATTIDQVVLSQDVTAEWAAIWRAVQDEREGK